MLVGALGQNGRFGSLGQEADAAVGVPETKTQGIQKEITRVGHYQVLKSVANF